MEHADRNFEGVVDAALGAAGVGVWDWNFDTDQVCWNDAMRLLFDRPDAPLDLPAARALEAIHADDLPEMKRRIAVAVGSRSGYCMDFRVRRRDGSMSHLQARGHAAYAADGAALRMTGIVFDDTERVLLEEKVARSENLNRSLISIVTAMIWTAAPDGTYGRPCPGWESFTGQTFAQYRGWGWLQAIHPADREHARAVLLAAFEGGLSYEDEYRIQRRDGEFRYTLARAAPVRNHAGAIVEWIGASTDVTEQRVVSAAAPSGICVITGDTFRVKWANAAYRQVMDAPWRERTISGLLLSEIIPGLEESSVPALFRQVAATRESLSMAEFRFDGFERGTTYWNWTLIALPAAVGQVPDLMIQTLEITENVVARHQVERLAAELTESEQRFRALANTIPMLCWMADAAGYIFWYNDRWYDYTGKSAAEMKGWGWQSVHDPAYLPRVVAAWNTSLETGSPFDMVFPLRGRDGRFRQFLTRIAPLRRDDGTIQLWFGTNTDITDQRELIEQRDRLLDSERAARVTAERATILRDEFLATLSHELRTPLNAILGWAQVIQLRHGASDPDLNLGLATIERNARTQSQLIEDLLDMSAIIAGKVRLDLRKISPHVVIEEALQSVYPTAGMRGITIRAQLDPSTGAIRGDVARLSQVLWNLLSNALKFTPRGGTLDVQLAPAGEQVAITVTDSGVGIAPEFLPQIFDRFRQADASTTRAHGGLGLGLAIVKQLVELHGGTVTADSPGLGQGATFTVLLPLEATASEISPVIAPQMVPMPVTPEPLAAIDLQGCRILVVDDEPDALEFLRRILEDRGALVDVAASADAALSSLERAMPDLLIADIGMPKVDGFELLQRIRRDARMAHLPAMAVTAFVRPQDKAMALRSGFQMHLAKPVYIPELLAAVASITGRTSSHR